MALALVIPSTVYGNTAVPFKTGYRLLTGALATCTAATVTITDPVSGLQIVDGAAASVAVPTEPAWPQLWGSGAGQIPEPVGTSKTYLVRWLLTFTGGAIEALPLMEWTVEPFDPPI